MLSRFTPASIAKRVALWLLSMIVILGFYGLGKFGAVLQVPHELPLSALDRAVPLLPWTVWLYGTITWGCLAAWASVPNRAEATRLLTAITIASASCCAVFLIFPTTFPRELHPLPGVDTATIRELTRLREADSPSNCLPSLHVALAWTIALTWSASRESKPLKAIAFVWAAVVSITTLTTKQHFVLDVPTGAAVGVFAWWGARKRTRSTGLALRWDSHQKAIAKLRRSVESYQWSLDEVEWPEGPLPPLDPTLERLINELIYIEEIAGMNFGVLARASTSDDLHALYAYFEAEERRHADGLRKVLALHGAKLRPPGLGNSLVLHEFDALDPRSNADVLLIATANPVFETMLDAGTVPFLRTHPALRSPWFDDFIKRITRDESAHLAVNWMVIREAGERYGGLAGLGLLINPSIVRGMISVPFMSLDVYSLAHQLGYRFETLLPAFGKLWRLHRRYPELRWFPLWWLFRVFTAAGAIATVGCVALARMNLMFVRFWTLFTRLTDAFARLWFGKRLLAKRGLPLAAP